MELKITEDKERIELQKGATYVGWTLKIIPTEGETLFTAVERLEKLHKLMQIKFPSLLEEKKNGATNPSPPARTEAGRSAIPIAKSASFQSYQKRGDIK